jgi:hypothetical protein
VLLVPGGIGNDAAEVDKPRAAAMARLSAPAPRRSSRRSAPARRCSRRAGLLGRAGARTTNKRAFDWVYRPDPPSNGVPQRTLGRRGKFVTSSGVSAGQSNMALHLIARTVDAEHGRGSSRA